MEKTEKSVRATKKQRELLAFIDTFIKGNNYGPSYREIMRALGYKSVSTVAVHVDGLISAGYLRKRDNSARSIEVLSKSTSPTAEPPSEHEAWLRQVIEARLQEGVLSESQQKTLSQVMELLGFDSSKSVQ